LKLNLFNSNREIALFLGLFTLILCLNLIFIHHKFRAFTAQNTQILQTKLITKYHKTSKNGKDYLVMRLKTDEFSFYTTSFNPRFIAKMDTLPNDISLNLKVSTKNLKFQDYLKKSFYLPSFAPKIAETKPNLSQILGEKIAAQHENQKITNLFQALFLAYPLDRELRFNVTLWGIAHLIAISGFHIGIIFAVAFFILSPIYRALQRRFFPHRSMKFDLSVLIFALLTAYLFLLDFVPSYLRSLTMGVLGFLLLVRNFRLINFQNLFLAVILLTAIFPHLAFSVGFYFSCLGVFYIFLFTRHFWGKFGIITDTIILNFYVFLAMNIPVYFFFPTISLQQISVIPLSYIFTIFYPFELFLHLLNLGDLLDSFLLKFLDFSLPFYKTQIPLWLFLVANFISLIAIWWRKAAILVPILGILPVIFITF